MIQRTETGNPTGQDLPAFCERCGYMLQGLPPQRCASCNLLSLRCPECGHTQHANSTRPALLRTIGRLRGTGIIVGGLVRVILCSAMALAWWVAGMEWSYAARHGSMSSNGDYVLLQIFAVFCPWVLVALLSHARHWIIPSLISLLLIAGSFGLGLYWRSFTSSFGAIERDGGIAMYSFICHALPYFLVGALTGWPVLRFALWTFWSARSRQLMLAWYRHGRMPRIDFTASSVARRLPFGEGIPLYCQECGQAIHDLPIEACPACSLTAIRCSSCGHHQEVNLLRPIAQQFLARVLACSLSLATLLMAGLVLAILFCWFVSGHEWAYTWNYSINAPAAVPGGPAIPSPTHTPTALRSETIVLGLICGLLTGLFLRSFTLRWRSGLVAGIVWGLLTAVAFSAGLLQAQMDYRVAASPFTSALFALLGTIAAAVFVSAALTAPAYRLLLRVFLPRKLGEAVLSWWQGEGQAQAITMADAEPIADTRA